ncbi:hypothetical protein LOTGIDRAFT_123412 [Lottia gigantea]|uniref:Major vault protein n=1 Tax=Lottia gigantea TaxID=225164 RepID=V4AAA9_LOTGI|nr:hypothetical protein LOTGIDRAFT_123412 [Lottia gigantea]ESO90246.1 hypothetical protein LOTGIDRAFT_123412 [Lottia gigantea]
MSRVISVPPFTFIHILNNNTNISQIEIGPKNFALQTNEVLITEPCPMVKVPPGHYCIILNPMRYIQVIQIMEISKYEAGKFCELKMGQSEVRLNGEPFPLYPGESLYGAENFGKTSKDYSSAIKPLPVIPANHALSVTALVDHDDGGVVRRAGDMWHIEGPITYIPTVEAEINKIVEPVVIKMDQVLRLSAKQDCIDSSGRRRVTGEEWYITEQGAYLQGVHENFLGLEEKITLTPDTGYHLGATERLTDFMGKHRLPGEAWLVTGEQTDLIIPQIEQSLVLYRLSITEIFQVNKRDACLLTYIIIVPGEKLESGIQNTRILSADETLVLQAIEDFTDDLEEVVFSEEVIRKAGDRWMITGPLEYIPPIHVKILSQRVAVPLSKNEGIYIQNIRTGEVRSVMGQCSYMLQEWEELWAKILSDDVEELLSGSGEIRKLAYYEQSIDPKILQGRNKTRVVTYRCPGNTAVQVYNYQKKTARVIFGPDLVILGPHENFNVLSLSAGKPKVPNALKSLCLLLGPDFITDIIEVETSDHARLQIKIAFNNYFEIDSEHEEKIFAVPDFIGFACNQIGGKIRGAIAQVPFDKFHRNSLQVIQYAVFGVNSSKLQFDVNNLVITSLDVQSIEPVDRKMRDSLSKSVQMAIEISTSSVEAAASHEAQRNEQIAKGNLERQKLANERNSERERTKLLELCAMTAAVESTGQAKAEAQANAEKTLIECHSEIEAAKLKAEAMTIEHNAKLLSQIQMRRYEIDYLRKENELELNRTKRMAAIEINNFENKVNALGVETLKAMARAGPETKIKLLQSVGLESMLVTDGNNPINLFNTSNGLIGASQTS